MPDVTQYDNQDEWMGVCVPKKLEEGMTQEQAVGACMGIWSNKSADTMIAFGDELKVISNDEKGVKVGGHLIRFGDKNNTDASTLRDFFNAETDFGLRGSDRKYVPIYFNHAQPLKNKDGRRVTVRQQVGEGEIWKDDTGVLIEAILYNREEYEKAIAGNYKKLGWSSGCMSHLMERETMENGTHFVKRWIIGEASATPIPAEPRKENMLLSIKSLFEADEPAQEKKEMPNDNTPDVKSVVDDAVKAALAQRDAETKAAADRAAEIEAEAQKKFDAMKSDYVKRNRLPDNDGVPYVTKFNDRKYNNYSGADLAFAASVLQSRNKPVSQAMLKSMLLKTISEKPNSGEREEDLNYIKSAIPERLQNEENLKAAEVMATSDSGNGAEWVATLYSPEIWRTIRYDGGIVSKIPSRTLQDGYNNEYVPLEGDDPTWYTVAETTATNSSYAVPEVSVTSSKAGTGQKNITLTKKGARSLYSGEMTEDSIVPFASQLREQLGVSGRELMEAWVINADSEAGATANVNDIAGTPAATDWFLGGNGFRKLALVTNTANSRSAGGALSLEDYLETMKLMGVAGIAASDLSKITFIVDPHVHFANMTLPEVKTRDVFSAATIENGFLKRAYGVEIMPSWQMQKGGTGAYALKANTAGKVDLDTNTNNTTGAILCVRFDQWTMRYKRMMTIETTRFANADAWEIVALARFGMAYRDTEASAISYNVGI